MVKGPRVAAIIQARLGSSRLPGKVLMPLAGKPVLWHIVHRLKQCRMVNMIAVTTPDLPGDGPLVSWCEKEGVMVFRGPEEDVLQRYAIAVEALDPEVILRVTGDSPLIDPATIDRLITALIKEDADYCTGDPEQPCIHEGFSPFSRRAMDRMLREAAADPVAVEHVSSYIPHRPDGFKIIQIDIPEEHHISGVRISVDTPADLRFLTVVYDELKAEAGEIEVADVVRLLKRRPELKKINQHIHQKAATEKTFRMVIRCDGFPAIGLGHIGRCLPLARQLRDHHGVGVSFAMSHRAPGPAMIKEADFPVDLWDEQTAEDTWLGRILTTRLADALLLDVRTDLSAASLAAWRNKGLMVATLDDPSERRLHADLAFYPPVPQLAEVSWPGFTGKLFAGWQWIPLRPEFGHKLPAPNNSKPLVAITMGGSDPAGLTLRILPILDKLHDMLDVRLILGRGFGAEDRVTKLMAGLKLKIDMQRNARNMAAALRDVDFAIASFGVTAYELAALGIPALLLSISADHARSAEALHGAGMAISLGEYSKVSDKELLQNVRKLITDNKKRNQMRDACALIDGRGVGRIAEKLFKRIKNYFIK